MNKKVYDLAQLFGLILIGVGVWQWSIPAALVVVGALLIIVPIIEIKLMTSARES